MYRTRSACFCVLTLLTFLTCSCVTKPADGRRRTLSGGASAQRDLSHVLDKPIGKRAGRTVTAQVLAEAQPAGTISYDNETLPLVSPDGLLIATQTGFAPSLDTILARPGAAPPRTTRIEIYEIPLTVGDLPQLRAVVDQAVVLGRACDSQGFLVEAPQENGSRWIGLASWQTGEVSWLVADDNAVSAFATLGPSGRLAWSSRPVNGTGFSLMVRFGADEWSLPSEGGDWLMPTWSGVSDGLFALLLRDGAIEAVHLVAADAMSVRRTIRRMPLAISGCTLSTAHQTLNATVVNAMAAAPQYEQLFFFHPAELCAAVWRPPAGLVKFGKGAFAAVADQDDERYALVTRRENLVRESLNDPMDRIEVRPGTIVARGTSSADRPYILLSPSQGTIGMTVMKFLPISRSPGN